EDGIRDDLVTGVQTCALPIFKEIGIERGEQTIDDGIVEKMVAHRQKKRFADTVSGGKKRYAILFLPVTVFDEGRAKASRNQLLKIGRASCRERVKIAG